MIVGIAQFALLVRDYDEAKDFYCRIFGFTVTEDSVLAGGKRWVRLLAPGKQGSEILLSKATDDIQREAVGNQAGGRVLFFMQTDNLDLDFKFLSSQGVNFTESPRTEPYGKIAVFKDLYGNRIDLIEPTAPT